MPLRIKSPLFVASLISLIFGFLVLAFPELLNYLVAMILIGLGIFGMVRQMQQEGRPADRA